MGIVFESINNLINQNFAGRGDINSVVTSFFSNLQTASAETYTFVIRWIMPLLAIIIFFRCILPLLNGRKKDTPWGYLTMSTGVRLPLMHWENSIGRSKLSDVRINLPFISRSHAVLTYCGGDWSIADLGSKGGVQINGEKIERQQTVRQGDVISLAGLNLTLSAKEHVENLSSRHVMDDVVKLGKHIRSGVTLFLIVLFQVLGCLELCFSMGDKMKLELPVTFILFIVMEILHFIIIPRRGGKKFELELLAYFLCGIGLFVTASASPNLLYKQFGAVLVGVVAFLILSVILKDLDRAQKLKNVLLVLALLLLAMNLVFGETRNGAKNWIDLGVITFQPTEFVKVAFVLAGAATLDRLLTTRNLTLFIAFSGACIGTLAITKDFGTALIFFCAFLVIAFMRSGDIRSIALITAGALLGALAVVSFMPYVSSRFSAWGHVWKYADSSGYQQTRTMIAAASGGMLGVGGGKGYLINVPAANTDIVFGVVCEEWGLIIAIIAVLIIAFFVLYVLSSVGKCRSSFYAISASGAATIFLVQTALNVFGSFDILPLTGVTLPFVSTGGTSLITCWCLFAFIKSMDERTGTVLLKSKVNEEVSREGWDE